MVDVSANADTLRALEDVASRLTVRRSALDGKVSMYVDGSETLESHLRYVLGTYGPVRLMPDAKEKVNVRNNRPCRGRLVRRLQKPKAESQVYSRASGARARGTWNASACASLHPYRHRLIHC